ncbi:DUF1911 domain-containing protein [Pseudomonas aeruginosa]|nr:DUF1911 domain-containing protein [Pseudomonas aeruginosa]
MHAFPLTLDNRLAEALPLWRNLARTDRAPRRNIDLADWKADWRELIAALDRFSRSHGYRQPFAAMGVLLDAQELIPALVEEVLQFDTDRLLDYLGAAALGLTSASEETFHPRPFGQLRAFFEEADGSDAQALAPYLQSQYREFFQLSPKAQKKTRRLTGPYAWGWWAMEVSALGVLYGWDDGVLRASPHYLGDLVDYARARGDA